MLGILQINRLVRKNLKIMIALFIIAIAVFIYMIYVLIKPEKF
jgi:K+-transporting ATPase KdpF subunit